MISLTVMTAALIVGQTPGPADALARDLSQSIVQKGYRRVGILPRFLQREDGQETLAGSMGPQGAWLADELAEALFLQSNGRFEVVDNRRLLKALQDLNITLKDLGEPEALQRVAREVGGLDAMIIGRATDERDSPRPGEVRGRLRGLSVTCNLVDLRSGSLAGLARQQVAMTPLLLAYRGEPVNSSNTLKGANTPAGTAPGLIAAPGRADSPMDIPGGAPGGGGAGPVGPADGGGQGGQGGPGGVAGNAASGPAGQGNRHPLQQGGYGFPMFITVDGKRREFVTVVDPRTGMTDLYVPLEPGENYQIHLANQSEADAYVTVWVDGINILGKKRDPEEPKVWNMKAGSQAVYRGWFTGEKGDYRVEEFVVKQADDSVAHGQGFTDAIGTIDVCVFGTQAGAAGEKGFLPDRFGTGAGAVSEERLGMVRGPRRGELLFAYRVYYAPKSQIEEKIGPVMY